MQYNNTRNIDVCMLISSREYSVGIVTRLVAVKTQESRFNSQQRQEIFYSYTQQRNKLCSLKNFQTRFKKIFEDTYPCHVHNSNTHEYPGWHWHTNHKANVT
jgi:hypothetical protein